MDFDVRPQGGSGKSPFRYPGGKAVLTPKIYDALSCSDCEISGYAEPYAGGAGAAIELLAQNVVDRLYLNDADPRIFAAWNAILDHNSQFIDRIRDTEITIDNWRRMHQLVADPRTADSEFDLGFATFFMNRTNRSGIILGAGPVGGYEQSGKWKLDARFYRETMIKRVEFFADKREIIITSNMDGVKFLRSFKAPLARSTFFFIDPPYVTAGSRLYLNTMNEKKHRELSSALKRKKSIKNWMMTYDDHPLIHEIYSHAEVGSFPIRYSLQKKYNERELLITPRSSL
ncbi:DNA adenine methylase [Qipengyuania sphaerica]|uniref:DNA adenine methylase n=1 Tax=Qipengyuania sphaerica TaxID=2867243 RepID=UPI001C877123|nr:DNA adenine methylase [Qipengyuania sphaerica]MBX7540489.1 DNA adenine methylase [Qipengyuania sphaerica]